MKDRKRIYDKRNIDKLENEVKTFVELNSKRFEAEKAEEARKIKKALHKKRKKSRKSKASKSRESASSSRVEGN